MADMREYKGTIRRAVKAEKDYDKNWNWTVKAVNKGKATIGWGYLDYIGETDNFIVEIVEDETCPAVVGTMPNGVKKYAFIGDSRWDDAKTFEEAVAVIIHSMATSAHYTY